MADSLRIRRWIAGSLCVAAITLLALECFVRVAIAMPFSANYVSPYHEAASAAAMLYVIGTWSTARYGSDRARRAAAVTAACLLCAGAIAFGLYHSGHGGTEVFVWDRMERVTPYHVQLAAPFFIAALAALVVTAVPRACARLRS